MERVVLDLLSGKVQLFSFPHFRRFDFFSTLRVPSYGTLYLKYGSHATSSLPVVSDVSGTIVQMSLAVEVADLLRSYELQLLVNDVLQGTLSLASGQQTNLADGFSISVTQGDEIKALFVRTAGSGESSFKHISASISIEES